MKNKLMKISILLFLITFSFLSVACTKKSCPEICAEIPASENTPPLTTAGIEGGFYYGQLSQKKPGTPDNWIHINEGTRSAGWIAPRDELLTSCDCKRHYKKVD